MTATKPPHTCEPYPPTCCCWMLATEPSDKCAIHGGYVEIPRCACGKFVRTTPKTEMAEQ